MIPDRDLGAGGDEALGDGLAKSLRAARVTGRRTLAVSGGVSCNRHLREKLRAACTQAGLELLLAEPALCTDNAAMIAAAAYPRFMSGLRSDFDMDVKPMWPLTSTAYAT